MDPRDARVRIVHGNDLDHRVLEWGDAAGAPLVVLVHGYMDAAGTWDLVAEGLVDHGFRVAAPEIRGFGDAPRASPGAYYHFADYVADLDGVVEVLSPDAPLFIAGHSMGGTIATYLAGARPQRVARLALLEGFGPPDTDPAIAVVRMRRWLDDLRAHREKRVARAPMTTEDAFRRLVSNNPGVDVEVLRTRLPHLVRWREDGRVEWRADPLHRTVGPTPFYAEAYKSFARRVACPVLAVGGGPTGFHPGDEAERVACFPSVERVELDGAGHAMHWTRPDQIAALLAQFFAPPVSPPRPSSP